MVPASSGRGTPSERLGEEEGGISVPATVPVFGPLPLPSPLPEPLPEPLLNPFPRCGLGPVRGFPGGG